MLLRLEGNAEDKFYVRQKLRTNNKSFRRLGFYFMILEEFEC